MPALTGKSVTLTVFAVLCLIIVLEYGVIIGIFPFDQWTNVQKKLLYTYRMHHNTSIMQVSPMPIYQQQARCVSPTTTVAFLKTYKTGSTTISSILIRFGLSHNLSFVIPAHHNPGYFSRTVRFNSEMQKHLSPPLPGSRYSMLVSHVPFNKTAINNVIPNATFITILRHPVATYESIFGFFKIPRILHLRTNGRQDPFRMFLSNTSLYYKRLGSMYYKTLLRNRQMFDVGLDPQNNDNETLRLCWEFEDILYIQQNTRNDGLRWEINDWKRQRILEINSADYKLCQHFNKTFWQKVRAYGDSFYQDLATFRDMLQKVGVECFDEGRYVIDYGNRRNRTLLKSNAPSYCSKIESWGFDEIAPRQNRKEPKKTLHKIRKRGRTKVA
ncbi:galactosylceramide sulfotransferase-like [Saccoglossus kowalevskii]|uniref:Galactosylceramide sulfotransferase-like n=1 Tax=Saccoglossus kowalevskii TaxID=10224 RepID=A0ABM0MQJ9_SACKO|nr:PREDICTED: galactosylceramide sulfotransferase-like [Saccoglossus kowalevskii]